MKTKCWCAKWLECLVQPSLAVDANIWHCQQQYFDAQPSQMMSWLPWASQSEIEKNIIKCSHWLISKENNIWQLSEKNKRLIDIDNLKGVPNGAWKQPTINLKNITRALAKYINSKSMCFKNCIPKILSMQKRQQGRSSVLQLMMKCSSMAMKVLKHC